MPKAFSIDYVFVSVSGDAASRIVIAGDPERPLRRGRGTFIKGEMTCQTVLTRA